MLECQCVLSRGTRSPHGPAHGGCRWESAATHIQGCLPSVCVPACIQSWSRVRGTRRGTENQGTGGSDEGPGGAGAPLR